MSEGPRAKAWRASWGGRRRVIIRSSQPGCVRARSREVAHARFEMAPPRVDRPEHDAVAEHHRPVPGRDVDLALGFTRGDAGQDADPVQVPVP